MKRILSFTLLTIIFVGCSTPYQSLSRRGGYSDIRLDENSFKIQFNGNAKTSKTRAIDFALLRAAELTLEHSYKYFIISEERQYNDVHYSPERTLELKGKEYNTDARYSTNPSASNTIICFKEKPEGVSPIYNAKYVVEDLCKKYDITLEINK